MHISFFVIHSDDLDLSVRFYSALGLSFVKEKHGNGLEHYAAELGQTVLEIYPGTPGSNTSPLVIGFHVSNLSEILEALQQSFPDILVKHHSNTRVMIAGPSNHKVQLTTD